MFRILPFFSIEKQRLNNLFMKVICLGIYPPRQCGIATFTKNLIDSIQDAVLDLPKSMEIEVMAMNDRDESYPYPSIVKYCISDQLREDYLKAADYINNSSASVLLVQHEFGIFGGSSGLFLLSLLREVKIPIVCILHTVLKKPNFHQREILERMAGYAEKLIVMNEIAIPFLTDIYKVPRKKIEVIPHGVPDFLAAEKDFMPPPVSWKGRKLMLTFGLIGRSKGIETVIRAMPHIVAKHPEILYVVLGKTHPNVVRHAGEEYREFLEGLVLKSNLQNHVVFMNQYTDELELMAMLHHADLYVTPYLNKAQITSGTLAYAVSGGCGVFSTPYWHAESLLTRERGWLFGFGNHLQLANLVNNALDHPDVLKTRQRNARLYGQTITWPHIGKRYADLLFGLHHHSKEDSSTTFDSPPFDISHLRCLTDGVGLLQHADGQIPAYRHGYSLDDNARAIIVLATACKHENNEEYVQLITKYFSFFRYMMQQSGLMKNFLTFDLRQMDDDFSDDVYGRSVWAMGYLTRYAPNDALFQSALDTFQQLMPAMDHLKYARGYANCIFGLFHYHKRFPDQERFITKIQQVADLLCERFEQHQRENWHWFEDALTYDNGLIPASLYVAYDVTFNENYLQTAEKSRLFLESKCFKHNWLSLVGNKRWLRFDTNEELFAQQPVDALAMMVMYKSAFLTTRQPEHIEKLKRCYYWFLGHNDLNISLYDKETKGCNDGIEQDGANRNQGAESTISWLLARLLMRKLI